MKSILVLIFLITIKIVYSEDGKKSFKEYEYKNT